MDLELLLGSMELEGQVAQRAEQAKFLSASSATQQQNPDHVAAFDAGYQTAVSIMLQGARRVLSEQLAALRPQDDEEVLRRVVSRVAEPPPRSQPTDWALVNKEGRELVPLLIKASQKKAKPAVILDLDGTVVDVSYRTLGILKEWLGTPEAGELPTSLWQRLTHINLTHVGYSLANAFENSGQDLREESVARAFELAERYWRQRFFDGRALLDYDRPVLGVTEFVKGLQDNRITIVYLTGRSQTHMAQGTTQQLERLGLSFSSGHVVMKPDASVDDHVFKQEAFKRLSIEFDIIGNFENEYLNLLSMMDFVPSDCVHVIVDTQHSGRPVPPNNRTVYRIRSYT